MDEMKICVVGLGKIGLPLAARFALSGATVVGCDLSAPRVELINAGTNPIENEQGLDDAVRETVASGRLRATTDTAAAVAASDFVIVIVPLIARAGGQLDFAALDAVVATISQAAHPGLTVMFETTLPVGTTRRFAQRIADASGLALGQELFAAFSPERVYSGRILQDLATYPKIVGGIDAESSRVAREFYERMLPGVQILECSAEEAEFAKLAETTYRDVNIALANEFASYAAERGMDATVAIAYANTQPFSHIHAPGVGVGGHCIPHYPQFLLADSPNLPLIKLARSLNDGQPRRIVEHLERHVPSLSAASVVILGVSYRENVRELTSSPGVDLIGLLSPETKRLAAHDPYFEPDEVRELGAEPVSLDELETFDVVILQAAHTEYGELLSRMRAGQILLDGRNAFRPEDAAAAGITYIGVGRPTRTP